MDATTPAVSHKFACIRGCTACCSGGPGFVWLSETDADRLAACLGITRAELLKRHCRMVDTGLGMSPSLNERPDYSCIFLGREGCLVYDARPTQCRTYPYWESIVDSAESWQDEARHCPGIGHGPAASAESIEEALHLRRLSPPILIAYGEADAQ